MEDIQSVELQGNYGYVLDTESNKVYLIIPSNAIRFEKVQSSNAAARLFELMSHKNAEIQEATWEEMDSILDAFYGENIDEEPEDPDFLKEKKTICWHGDGKFRSYIHAPNTYAFNRYILNCATAQLKIEKKFRELEQDSARKLLSASWFSHSKESFSWSPLIDGFLADSSEASSIQCVTPNLTAYNKMVFLANRIENKLKTEHYNVADIQKDLTDLKELLNLHERNNIFIALFLGLVGIVVAPLAFLIGLMWIIPAYLFELPYLGKPLFFLDTFQWFIDSCLATAKCLIFPIAIIHAYNTTGSCNLLKGECTRIVETLQARISNAPARLSIQPPPTNDDMPWALI